MNNNDYDSLDLQEQYFSGLDDGLTEGIEEGIMQSQKDIVINMYKKKVPINTISQCTNITVSKILEIIDSYIN